MLYIHLEYACLHQQHDTFSACRWVCVLASIVKGYLVWWNGHCCFLWSCWGTTEYLLSWTFVLPTCFFSSCFICVVHITWLNTVIILWFQKLDRTLGNCHLKYRLLIVSCVCAAFEPFHDAHTNTLLPKLMFVALNLGAMGLGLWKVRF